MRFLWFFLFTGLSTAGYSIPEKPGIKTDMQTTSRTILEQEYILKDGSKVRYTLSMPELKPQKSYPLIVALHYGGNVTPFYSRGFLEILVGPGFQQLEAIILAPDCPGQGWTNPESSEAVLELIHLARQKWPVDSNRLVLTGFSMGGTGCWYFAMNHPELFSALIPMASIPPAGVDLKIPAYVIHGENDELFPVDRTEQYVQEIRERGGNMKFIMVKGISHYQTSEYAHVLQSSVKWLKQIWKDQKR